MALGAIIASVGYFIGTLNNLNAEDEIARVKKLVVSEEILVKSSTGATLITPTTFVQMSPHGQTLIVGPIVQLLTSMNEGLDMTKLSRVDYPLIRLSDSKGKRITLQIDDEASIKLNNGGLNSKIFTVEDK